MTKTKVVVIYTITKNECKNGHDPKHFEKIKMVYTI